jgi:hypothetical protein
LVIGDGGVAIDVQFEAVQGLVVADGVGHGRLSERHDPTAAQSKREGAGPPFVA